MKFYLTLILCTTFGLSTIAFEFPTAPNPHRFVNDFTGFLNPSENIDLENVLSDFEKETSNEIAIIIVKSLHGYSPNEYATSIANKWGVGKKAKNNGIVILIKPKYKDEKGEIYIAIGYGLEGKIPDIIAKRIIEETIIPKFKEGRYYNGLKLAIDILKERAISEFNDRKEEKRNNTNPNYFLLFLPIIILPFAYVSFAKKRKISDSFSHLYFEGEYSIENIIGQLERLSKVNGKNYDNYILKLEKYRGYSLKQIEKYSTSINRALFCFMLNDRDRFNFFKEVTDWFLNIIFIWFISSIILLPLFFTFLIDFPLAVSIFYSVFAFGAIFYLFSLFPIIIEIFLFSERKNNGNTKGLSIAFLAVNLILMKNIKKQYNKITGKYYYTPIVIYDFSLDGSGGGSLSGGYSGGGFSGGSFGGGGAGGSW